MTVSPTINVDVGFPDLAFGQLKKMNTFSAFVLHVLGLSYSFFWITYLYVGGESMYCCSQQESLHFTGCSKHCSVEHKKNQSFTRTC